MTFARAMAREIEQVSLRVDRMNGCALAKPLASLRLRLTTCTLTAILASYSVRRRYALCRRCPSSQILGEILDHALHRVGGGLAETADGGVPHHLGEIAE